MSYSTPSADVVIVGTGAAGLFCALHLPENLSIYMLTKDTLENSASYLAQGGIAALKDSEDYEDYFEDTLRAGHYENSRKAVDTMIRQSPVIIRELLDYHVNFDKKGDDLDLTKEGGHSASRILHHEDITGQEITSKLLQNVREKKNIDLHEHTTMIDLICEKNVCKGIITQDQEGNFQAVFGKAVVLATGGIGGLFKHSTAFRHITGDSLAIAIPRSRADLSSFPKPFEAKVAYSATRTWSALPTSFSPVTSYPLRSRSRWKRTAEVSYGWMSHTLIRNWSRATSRTFLSTAKKKATTS